MKILSSTFYNTYLVVVVTVDIGCRKKVTSLKTQDRKIARNTKKLTGMY